METAARDAQALDAERAEDPEGFESHQERCARDRAEDLVVSQPPGPFHAGFLSLVQPRFPGGHEPSPNGDSR